MSSIKCRNCDLVNFESDAECRRCRTPLAQTVGLTAGRAYQSSAERTHSLSSFQAPPPPSFYALGATALPSFTCMKCGVDSGVEIRSFTKEHLPPVALFALLLGFLPGLIIVMLMKAKHRLDVPLCPPCYSKVRFVPLLDTLTSLFCLVGILASIFVGVGTGSWPVFAMAIGPVVAGVVLGRAYCRRNDLKFKQITTRVVVVSDPVRGEVRLVG